MSAYEMGPRLDVSQAPEEPDYPSPRSQPHYSRSGGGGGGTVLGVIALLVAFLGLGLGLWAVMVMPERNQGPMLPPPAADVVPGGAAERVAKLEKDVGSLMLRLVTLEKELENMRGRAGAVTKLTEVAAKVAALQERLDALGAAARPAPRGNVEAPARPPAPRPETRSEARPEARPETRPETAQAPRHEAARPEAAARQAAKPEPKPEAKLSPLGAQVRAVAEEAAEEGSPRKSKVVYTVRRGDTLFTVAQRYKVSLKDIQRWNDLKPGQPIQPDQQLVIYR